MALNYYREKHKNLVSHLFVNMKIMFISNRPDISFGLQSKILEDELRNMGHDVLDIDHTSSTKIKIDKFSTFKPDVLVIWTFFHDVGHPTITVDEFRQMVGTNRDFFLIGFEVSDTDRLSDKAISMVNELNPDVLVTPSRWSANGFHDVNIPIVILPHALDPYILEKKDKYRLSFPLLEGKDKHVYIYAQHSLDRKGTDISLNVVNKLYEKRQDFNLIIKSLSMTYKGITEFKPDKYILRGFVSRFMHYAVMKKGTHFFYPVRGGAFEIPVLEALALGLTVIIPDKGAWVDIPLNKDDVYWIKVDGLKRYWFDNPYHVGNFVEPDVDDAYDKLNEALDNRKNVNSDEYLKEYSPENIAKQFVDIIKS